MLTSVLETSNPDSYVDAQGQHKWEQAMTNEMESLLNNNTWDLVPQPQGKNIVKCRWVLRPNLPIKVLLSVIKIVWS